MSALFAVILVLWTVAAGMASAHAVLERTSPSDGAVLKQPPRRVLLQFGEAVTAPSDAIKVYDQNLRRVDAGSAGHLTDRADTVGVGLERGLPAGTYTVTWRVISADSHPVSGGFRFSVGHRSTAAAPTTPPSSGTSTASAVLVGSRWLGYAGAALGIGASLVLIGLWPRGADSTSARHVVGLGWVLLAVGGILEFVMQGPYTAGVSARHLFDLRLLSQTLATEFGSVMVVRFVLLLVLAAFLAWFLRPGTSRASRLLSRLGVVGTGLGVLVTMALIGHASTGALVPLSLASDTLHLSAMATWIGGLVVLCVCLLPRHRTAELASVLPGFSRLAMGCVAALVITGGYQAWREVRYLPAFIHTTYGLLLTAKLSAVLVLIALGNLARRWVQRHYVRPVRYRLPSLRPPHASDDTRGSGAPDSPTRGEIAVLRKSLAGEVLIAATVIAITAVLVGTAQAKETYTPTYTTQVRAGSYRLQVSAHPAHTGPSTLVVHLSDTRGKAVPLDHVTGSLALPEQHVGPLPATFHSHGSTARAHTTFSTSGDWQLNLSIRTSPTSATTYQVRIPVI